jgi:hypothetical protein
VAFGSPSLFIAFLKNSIAADFTNELCFESISTKIYAFMADVDAWLVEQVLGIAQGQRKPDVHQHA